MPLLLLQPPNRWEDRLADDQLLSLKLNNALSSSCAPIDKIAAEDDALYVVTNFQEWESYRDKLQEQVSLAPLLSLVALPHPLTSHTQTVRQRLKFFKANQNSWFKDFPYTQVLYVLASTMGGLTLAFDIVALKAEDCDLALSLPPEFVELIRRTEVTVIIDSHFSKKALEMSDILPPNYLVGHDVFQKHANSVFGKGTEFECITQYIMWECFEVDVLNLKPFKGSKSKGIPILKTKALLEFELPLQNEHRALLRHYAVAQIAFILKFSLFALSRPQSIIQETTSLTLFAHSLIDLCSTFQNTVDSEPKDHVELTDDDINILYGDLGLDDFELSPKKPTASAKPKQPKASAGSTQPSASAESVSKSPGASDTKKKPSLTDDDVNMDESKSEDPKKADAVVKAADDPPSPPTGACGGPSDKDLPKVKLPHGGKVNIGRQNNYLCILDTLRDCKESPSAIDRYIGELINAHYLEDMSLKFTSSSTRTITRWQMEDKGYEVAIEVRKLRQSPPSRKAPSDQRSLSTTSEQSSEGSYKAHRDSKSQKRRSLSTASEHSSESSHGVFKSPPDSYMSTAASPVTPDNPYLDRPAQFGCYGCGSSTHNKNKRDEDENLHVVCPKMLEQQGQVLCDYPPCHYKRTHFTAACQDMVRACTTCDIRGHWNNQCSRETPAVWRARWETHADKNIMLRRRRHGQGAIEWGAFRFRSQEHLAAYKRLAPVQNYKAYSEQPYQTVHRDYMTALFSLPNADQLIRPSELNAFLAYRDQRKPLPPAPSAEERQNRTYAHQAQAALDRGRSGHSSKDARRQRHRSSSSRVASPNPTDTAETAAELDRMKEIQAQLARQSAKIKALRAATQQKLEAERAADVEEAERQLQQLKAQLAEKRNALAEVRHPSARSPQKKKAK